MVKQRCSVKGKPCLEHGFIHGGEAEELRAGIEAILRKWCDDEDAYDALSKLLDDVDARDSLAFREATDPKTPKKKKARKKNMRPDDHADWCRSKDCLGQCRVR